MKSLFLLKNDNVIGGLLALVAFGVYFVTVGPSTGFIDAGELAADAYTFGVAHPTGYPVFTLLAGVFSHLPLGGTVIWRLNLLAALFCAASIFFFYRVFLRLLGAGPSQRLAAACGVLILAFSRTFWSQAVGVEVYSLHLLLVSLILWLFLRALPSLEADHADERPHRQRWQLFSFVLGLSFANHMTTLLLLPALLYLYFAVYGSTKSAWLNAARSFPFFLLGLLPYLYLPLRASAHPFMNWGAIVDLRSFLWHLSGRQYSGWMFSSFDSAEKNLALFADTLGSEFGYLALLPALLGLWAMFRRSRRVFTFVTLLLVGCLAYSVNYDIADIVNYFLLAYIAIAISAAFGILYLPGPNRVKGPAKAAGLFLAAACFLVPLVTHYREVDESGNYATEDYARAILNATEPDAVILTTQWDHFIAAAYYLQQVEGVRPDVMILDRELLRRTWYLRYLAQRHPDLTSASRREIAAFLPEVQKFEAREPYDPAMIQGTFVAMVRSLLVNSMTASRPVYVTPEIENEYLDGFGRVPSGPLMRLFVGAPPGLTVRDFDFRPFPKPGPYFDILKNYYAQAYANQGIYRGMQGDLEGSERSLRKALAVQPGFAQAGIWLQQVEAERARRAGLPAGAGAP